MHTRYPRRRQLVILAILLAAVAWSATAQAATYPVGFEERTVVSGLSGPVGVAWAPDGRAFVIEKAGRLKVVNPGATTAATVLDISGKVLDNHDRGLLGVAVDSAFATNRYLYLLYSYDTTPLTPDGDGAHVSRLTRIQVNPDNTLVNPSNPETVLIGSYISGPCQTASNTHDCIPADEWSHSIGTVRSAPDGTLWLGNGDASKYQTVDPRALRTYDETSMAGKILHVDRNGRGLPGHPFCPANTNLDHVCTKVHSKGFRNPYRFKLRPGGGLTVGDVGWNTREEVDLIPTGAGSGGRSYGWPCYEGTIRTPGYTDRGECPPEYAKEGTAQAHLGPSYDYPHVGGSAVLGGPEYTGDQYPAGYRGSVFFGDYSAGLVKRMTIGAQGQVAGVQSFATSLWVTDLEPDLSGDLTYVLFGNGSAGTGALRRIVYSPGNRTPVAAAAATPTSGPGPLDVQFSSSGSTDADGDPLGYDWDFGDGSAHSSSANPTHRYVASGVYTARLTVSDGRGLTGSATVQIAVGGSSPTATIETPLDESTHRGGQTIALRGSATDAEDGPLPASKLDWQVRQIHLDHVHPVVDRLGVAETSFVAGTDHDADSYYEITLTATDSTGLQNSKTIQIRPQTAAFALESSPVGAPLSYAGTQVTAPFSTQAAVGFLTTVTAADEFVSGGRRYRFDSWSDGGPRVHDVTIPATATTLRATYRDVGSAGLVAAYGFEEGTGATVADSSGTGNAGALSGPTWSTSGRYGKALSFDGVNDWVTVPDADSLDLTIGMTVEAWVRPTSATAWKTVLMKEYGGDWLTYGLYAVSATNVPSLYAWDTEVSGTAALPQDAWSHLAATFDGATVRLYVNGTLVRSLAHPDPLPASGEPLRIGGNSIWDEFFKGLIDDVRVYNRALSQAEIAADRDTPVGGQADTTPPSVQITAPANGATVSGTVQVSASASDNTAVAGVQFKLDGQNLAAEDTTAPYAVSWDTTGATNGAHSLTAVARDGAGNAKTSTAVSATVNNAPPPPPPPSTGLVAAYGFKETSGATVVDSSPEGNTGTISGATRTTSGRYGRALTFDGVNDWVTVPDDASLDLTTGMTLEAWVRPTSASAWKTVLMKEYASSWLSYGLYAVSETNRPSAYAWATEAAGGSALPQNAWSHLAATFDGQRLRLYVNGTEVGNVAAATSPLPVGAAPLRIGGNAIWGEYFKGRIDEVRIYSRALSAAEIAADRDSGI